MNSPRSVLLSLAALIGAVPPAFAAEPAARWAEIEGVLEIPATQAPSLGKGDFSLSLWIDAGDDPGGDLVSQYDLGKRRGFHLTLKSNSGVVSNQPNWRHLQFGIDDKRSSEWTDCGKPGQSLFAFGLAVHEGALYAGTCEPGPGQSGRVYRLDGERRWVDCGSPDRSNSVTSLAVFEGELYAGTGKYRVAGSSLPESENTTPGGRVFRYGGGDRWIDCGQLPGVEAVGGLVVFQGKLHASSLYRPPGFFRYEGGTEWTVLPVPQGPDATSGESVAKRVVPLGIHDDHLYAGSYDGGHIYRFEGETWTDCGRLGENTQTYSLSRYGGALVVGTWPSGRVYRFEELGRWTDLGRLGEETEVMGMLVHNGRLLGGTLPLAEVYEYRGGQSWQRLARLDHTPEVKYRRAWTLAEHQGRVYASTLPSGAIHSFAAGCQTQWGHSLPSGWHHVAAVKTSRTLALYLDGNPVARAESDLSDYDLAGEAALRIGSGQNGPFRGKLRDLRIFHSALSEAELRALASESLGDPK